MSNAGRLACRRMPRCMSGAGQWRPVIIFDLDNPYSLTSYNLLAMRLYRPLLRVVLRSRRCVAIRCMSEPCRETLRALFGEAVARRSTIR